MKIAVVTGASSGIGREFAKQIARQSDDIDEIWLIARREELLQGIAKTLYRKARVLAFDLTDKNSLLRYQSLLEDIKPQISILVNAAGFGKFGSTISIPITELDDLIELNVKATVDITLISLPFMTEGSKIIHMSSVSAFTPLPFFNLYAASKAFVLSFSKSLSNELKKSRISVTAVCPYWVETEFNTVAKDVPNPTSVTNFIFIRKPDEIVRKALSDAQKNKLTSLYGVIEHLLLFLSKVTGSKTQMYVWNKVRNFKNKAKQ